MEPVSNVDRLMLLLRQKLAERAKANGGGRASGKPPAGPLRPAEPSGLQAVAAVEGNEERPLRQAFVQHLLADQLGPGLINDAQFQQVVSRVTDAIDDDPHTAQLLTRLITELRGG